jgi:Alw26I/Eco31I/Esp3I family type II restriction endonuclease
MKKIMTNKNYKDIPCSESWVVASPAKREKRKKWADKKIKALEEKGIFKDLHIKKGKYRILMYYLHPTKEKPCSICGKILSLKYIYPNKRLYQKLGIPNQTVETYLKVPINIYELLEKLNKKQLLLLANIFEIKINTTSSVSTIKTQIKHFLDNNFLDKKTGEPINKNLQKFFSPGAMSNFPDRLDGFHTYNLCCRKKEDKGRHNLNMASYSEDRRIYEFWNDGDHQKAKAVIAYITKTLKKSADHVGPISLGFVHDPINIKPIENVNANSSKNNRLSKEDLKYLIEKDSSETPIISWYSRNLWTFIKEKYTRREISIKQIEEILKTNQLLVIYLLRKIKQTKNGSSFLIDQLIKPKLENILKSVRVINYQKENNLFSFEEKTSKRREKERHIEGRGPKKYLDGLDKFWEKKNRKINRKTKGLIDTAENSHSFREILKLIEKKQFSLAMEKLYQFLNRDIYKLIIKNYL